MVLIAHRLLWFEVLIEISESTNITLQLIDIKSQRNLGSFEWFFLRRHFQGLIYFDFGFWFLNLLNRSHSLLGLSLYFFNSFDVFDSDSDI